ncbi:hypothetical protein C8R43DRAFT_869463 [Mycena crocata]|nr:hypothetical protein C8R43DRAFT_869463 [Mycena crocata]
MFVSAPPAIKCTPSPPTRIYIDISDSSPIQSPKPQKQATSPSASQARPKRKHTSSLPPSTLGTPAAKRPKIAVVAQKHKNHWALDGSIVIQIQETKFKLHKSVLAKHSPWFAGLFDGKTVTGGEYVERDEDGSTPMYILALPTLHSKDFVRLLDAFDNAITYVHEDPSFIRIAGVLRVSTLLSFTDFREWAVRILEDKWSPSLADLTNDRIKHATESVLIARSCDVPSILKRAMYELVRLAGYDQNEDQEGVSTRDFRMLIRAREELTAVWLMTTSESPFSPTFSTCASQPAAAPPTPVPAPVPAAAVAAAQCTTLNPLLAGKAHHKLIRESGIADDYLYDPLCGLQMLIDADWAAEGYCAACVELRREMWANRREKVWDNLDIWFGLEAA